MNTRDSAKHLLRYAGDGPSEHNERIRVVCHALLDEHPADEDELVSEEWLLSIGGTVDDDCVFFPMTEHRRLEFYLFDEAWQAAAVDDGENQSVWLGSPTTRGQVRRLCTCLGITLTNQGTEG